MLQNKYLTKADFNLIGKVAPHCDYSKLDISIQQSIDFDIKELLCDYWWKVKVLLLKPVEELTEVESKLIYGGEYTSCGSIEKDFKGLKAMMTYYAYARYVLINPYDDTATGLVKKNVDFSTQLQLKELERLSDQYRTMGYTTWKELQEYLCVNKDVLEYKSKDCTDFDCGCNSGDCGGTKAKGYGFKFKTIRK